MHILILLFLAFFLFSCSETDRKIGGGHKYGRDPVKDISHFLKKQKKKLPD